MWHAGCYKSLGTRCRQKPAARFRPGQMALGRDQSFDNPTIWSSRAKPTEARSRTLLLAFRSHRNCSLMNRRQEGKGFLQGADLWPPSDAMRLSRRHSEISSLVIGHVLTLWPSPWRESRFPPSVLADTEEGITCVSRLSRFSDLPTPARRCSRPTNNSAVCPRLREEFVLATNLLTSGELRGDSHFCHPWSMARLVATMEPPIG